jgi:hypothetical protein
VTLQFDEDDYLLNHACPRCGGKVYRDFACHTYPSRTADGTPVWMSCLPCDSAVLYACEKPRNECGWSYTNGLNPRNPRAAENEANRPDWMPAPDDDPWLKPLPTLV